MPSLLKLFDGTVFPLKQHNPDLYDRLCELNKVYNELSKHFNMDRAKLFADLTYDKLAEFHDATRRIWLFVVENCQRQQSSLVELFLEPDDFIKHSYYPAIEDE